jgi:hypothetical protein
MKSNKYFLVLLISFFVACGLFLSSTLSADPPENSGPHVFRYEEVNWFGIFAGGMVAFVGADVPLFCEFGPDNPFGVWRVKDIENPAEQDLIVKQWKGDDVVTFVYPEAAVVMTEYGIDVFHLCEFDAMYGEVASGTTDAIITDNDAFAARNYHARANSWGLSAQGFLLTQSGDPVKFSGGFRCVWKNDPDPDKVWGKCNDHMNLAGQ